jgi:hypothetical protein
MVKVLSSCRPDDIMDISDGYHLLKDGDAWCAVGPVFADLQRSPAGFGDTQEEPSGRCKARAAQGRLS